jgi:hypothetical protein
MGSEKSIRREYKSESNSSGDRRAGSVGERPELAGSRDNADRSSEAEQKLQRIRSGERQDGDVPRHKISQPQSENS